MNVRIDIFTQIYSNYIGRQVGFNNLKGRVQMSVSQTYLTSVESVVPPEVTAGLSVQDAYLLQRIYAGLDVLARWHNQGHVGANLGLTVGVLLVGSFVLSFHGLLDWWVVWQIATFALLLVVLAGCRFLGWYLGQSVDYLLVKEVRSDILEELETDGGDTARLLSYIKERDHRPGYASAVRRLFHQANEA